MIRPIRLAALLIAFASSGALAYDDDFLSRMDQWDNERDAEQRRFDDGIRARRDRDEAAARQADYAEEQNRRLDEIQQEQARQRRDAYWHDANMRRNRH